MEDSTNNKSEYLLQKDLKDHLYSQYQWNTYFPIIVNSKRKITKQTWEKIVLIEAVKNNINLKISRNDSDDSIHFLSNDDCFVSEADPYAIEGVCNASS